MYSITSIRVTSFNIDAGVYAATEGAEMASFSPAGFIF